MFNEWRTFLLLPLLFDLTLAVKKNADILAYRGRNVLKLILPTVLNMFKQTCQKM